MNVFSGPSAIIDFHNPDKNPPLPLVEIPSHPFLSQNVRIYAKMLTMLPSSNVKSLAAHNMMDRATSTGEFDCTRDNVVEYSSGNTITSLAILNTMRGGKHSEAYISNKTSREKMNMLRFFGLELTLFGGPGQVEPADPYGGIANAIKKGKEPGYWNPGQYHNRSNTEAHIRWTGPQLAKQLPHISIFSASIGTSGTMTGTGSYLKELNPKLVNLGVFTAPCDNIPGPRPADIVLTIDLPWREVIDEDENVSSVDAYKASLDLCRQGLLVGPSSGMALVGLYQYLEKLRPSKLDALRGDDGTVTCVFICCDLPFLYIGDYFKKLPSSFFPKINNSDLIGVDPHPYVVEAKLTPAQALALTKAYPRDRALAIVDLRHKEAFKRSQIQIDYGLQEAIPTIAKNIPVEECSERPVNAFLDIATLITHYQSLEQTFGKAGLPSGLAGRDVLFVCTYGTISSTACSVLRAHHSPGAKAWYVDGGIELWRKQKLPEVVPVMQRTETCICS